MTTPPRDGSDVRPRSIGLVLGAGGVAAFAFHTGALAALADHAGWDGRQAELVIGTSAGAGIAALLRGGLHPADAYDHLLGRAPSPEGAEFFARLPSAAWDSGADAERGLPLPVSPALALRGMLRWPPRPGLALAGSLPRGVRSSTPMGDRYRAVHPDWPASPLWLCSVRVRDGQRIVFGRDDHPPLDVGTAVQASSAVPGFFTPVRVGQDDFVDGGTWSCTNADLTTGLGFDAVVVIAPLSTPYPLAELGRRPSPQGAYRAYHRAVLEAELRRVRHTGTPVIAIEPTEDDLRVLNGPAPADGRRPDIAERVHASVQARFASQPALRNLLSAPVPR